MGLVDEVKEVAEPLTDGKLDWRDAVSVAKLLALAGIVILQLVAALGGPNEAPSDPPAMETDTDSDG